MKPNNRVGTYDIATLRTMVSARDLQILLHVRSHKFLTTKHIQRLLFWEHATTSAGIRACVRVLTRLEGRNLLYRLERQIGGVRAGSGSYVWGIAETGDRLLRVESARGNTKRSRAFEPSPLFLAHTLAIAETRVLLEEAARRAEFELVAVTTEPANWRSFTTGSGTQQLLKPDLQVVTAHGDYEDHWFIEIDNGTESLPTLIVKCLAYQRHYATGREQAASGVYPVVVWLLADPRRRKSLVAAITRDGRLDERLFRVVAPDVFVEFVANESVR